MPLGLRVVAVRRDGASADLPRGVDRWEDVLAFIPLTTPARTMFRSMYTTQRAKYSSLSTAVAGW